MAIGPRVRERRMALGLSQEHLAHGAGISLNAVHKLEMGRITDPHYSTLERLAHGLGTTVAELVGEEALAVPLAEPEAPLARLSPDEFDELRASASAGEASLGGAKLLEGVLHEYNGVEAYWKRLEQAGAPAEDLEEARELLVEARKRWRVVMFDRIEETIAADDRRDPGRVERPDIRGLSLEEAHAQLTTLQIVVGAR